MFIENLEPEESKRDLFFPVTPIIACGNLASGYQLSAISNEEFPNLPKAESAKLEAVRTAGSYRGFDPGPG